MIDAESGRVAMRYNLYNNTSRTVKYNRNTGQPEDTAYQDPSRRIPSQMHY
jgi:hypothetical protein